MLFNEVYSVEQGNKKHSSSTKLRGFILTFIFFAFHSSSKWCTFINCEFCIIFFYFILPGQISINLLIYFCAIGRSTREHVGKTAFTKVFSKVNPFVLALYAYCILTAGFSLFLCILNSHLYGSLK